MGMGEFLLTVVTDFLLGQVRVIIYQGIGVDLIGYQVIRCP